MRADVIGVCRPRRHDAAGGAAGLRSGCPKQRRLLSIRDVLAGVAGAALGARQGCPGALHRSPAVAEATRARSGRAGCEPAHEQRRRSRRRSACAILSTHWRSRQGSRMARRGGAVSSKNATRMTIRSGSSTRSAARSRRRARSSATHRAIAEEPAREAHMRQEHPGRAQRGIRAHRGCLWRVACACAHRRCAEAIPGEARRRDPQTAGRSARPQPPGFRGPTIVSASTPVTAPASPARVVRPSLGASRHSSRNVG